jgi:tetratricopeptide (TPR) repeat protein
MTNEGPVIDLAKMTELAQSFFQTLFDTAISSCKSKSGDYGLSTFRGALAIQESVLGRFQHPDTARTYFWIGRALAYQEFFDESIEEYQRALSIQESLLGLYHDDTGLTYHWLGQAYHNVGDCHKGLVAFRTSARIQQTLYGIFHAIPVDSSTDCMIQSVLQKGGCPPEQIQEHRHAMIKSLRYEKAGDGARRKGDWKSALQEYEKAAQLEDSTFGSYNPSLALLWRKIACISSMKNGKGLVFPPAADLISPIWMKGSSVPLFQEACQNILHGDKLYTEKKYEQAMGEYFKTTLVKRKAAIRQNAIVQHKLESFSSRRSMCNKNAASVDGTKEPKKQEVVFKVVVDKSSWLLTTPKPSRATIK